MLRQITLKFLVVFIMISCPCFAQEVADMPVKTEVTSTKEGYVSLDFRDASIKNVLDILSLKSGVNIVTSPEVKGMITLRLNEVPWQDALDVILQTYGYAYEKRGNIILVSSVGELKKRQQDNVILSEQEPLVTKTFTLSFAKASQAVESISKMKSNRGNINFDERTNTLIITDITRKMDLMENVIKKLDTTTPLISIEAKIVKTSFDDRENLGINWTNTVTAYGAARPIVFPFDKSGQATTSIFAPDAFPGADTATTENTQFAYGTLDFTSLKAVFDFLKTKEDTNILSNPRIVTLDNQTATIKVGEQYPIPQYAYNKESDSLQITGMEYKDIGIIFNVTPHVNKSGFVTLDVEPQLTAIISGSSITIDGVPFPRLSSESAKTSVIIKEGDTLVIGGLLTNQTTDERIKTPFLGDIPIVGLAFQRKNKSVVKRDLMIFITPHIVTPEILEGS